MDFAPEIYVTTKTLSEALKLFFQSFWFWLLVTTMFFDVFTGTWKSLKYKNWDSTLSKDGLIKHVTVLLLGIAIGTLTRMSGYKIAVSFSTLAAVGFILSYVGSILENCDAIGVSIPEVISQYFNRSRLKYEEKVTQVFVDDQVRTTSPNEHKEIKITKKTIVDNPKNKGE